jgi:hypothetical protein
MGDTGADVEVMAPEASSTERRAEAVRLQADGYLLELSLDWIVRRASDNAHHFVGKSHVTLIDEPLGRFVQAQALHDLRNLFSRLSGTTGIARAYRVRLTEDHTAFDIAFQLIEGRVLVEAVPSGDHWVGQALGTVGGLAAGLDGLGGQPLLDAAARRMRALTGFDRVTLEWGGERAESSRGNFAGPARALADLPTFVSDCNGAAVNLYPGERGRPAAAAALLRAPSEAARTGLREQGVAASLCVAFSACGRDGQFRADSRTRRAPGFELHAAAELFAQIFALRLENEAR